MPDVAQKVTDLAMERHGVALNVAVLRSTTVPPGERRAWFAACEAEGVHLVLCNPRLVKTGLNLIAWPSIVVLEPVYSLFTLHQAKRRAFRPTQTRDCEVTYVCYADSMSERAISIVARKSAAAAILNGDDLSNGLLEFDPGMSLLQELAKAVMADDTDRSGLTDDVRAMLRDGALALRADLGSGVAGLVGVDVTDTLQMDVIAMPEHVLEVPGPLASGFEVEVVARPHLLADMPLASCADEPTIVQVSLIADDAVADDAIGDGASNLEVDSIVAASMEDAIQLSLFGDVMPMLPRPPRSTHRATLIQAAML